MYLIIKNGMRLCKDNCIRNFANYGSFSECVKWYKSLGAAKGKADSMTDQQGVALVVQPPDGMEVDAVGRVIERKEVDADHEAVIHHKLDEFTVYRGQGRWQPATS